MNPLNIGVDLGSSGLRVAYALGPDEVVALDRTIGDEGEWITCEPAPGDPTPVRFPSVKSLIGTRSGPRSADDVVTRAFDEARREVERRTGRTVAQAVICVPALYSTSQREAVHDAAVAGGFAAVHLINDTVGAATAASVGSRSASTVLVCGAGYRGFELGVARVANGRVRVLAYEGGTVAGSDLDRILLGGLLDSVAAAGSPLHESAWHGDRWQPLWEAVRDVKERVATAESVADLTLGIVGAGGINAFSIVFSRTDFDERLRETFAPTVQLVDDLLRSADVTDADIDTFVLAGGTARIPGLRSVLVEAVGRTPTEAAPSSLAVGAAIQAAGLGTGPGLMLFDQQVVDARAGDVPTDASGLRATARRVDDDAPPTAVTVPARPARRVPSDPPETPSSLERHVAELVATGDVERARGELTELVRCAQRLLDGLPTPVTDRTDPTSPSYRSRLALDAARTCLAEGDHAGAISESHYAWRLSSNDPAVLDQMIDVHCHAAMAYDRPEQYEDSLRWLHCALGHDETNVKTRSLLAERHFRHARHLYRSGRAEDALRVVEDCLRWSPGHPDAARLQTALVSR